MMPFVSFISLNIRDFSSAVIMWLTMRFQSSRMFATDHIDWKDNGSLSYVKDIMPITLISDHKIFLIIKYSFELFFSDK
jgi:hypothetical protein